MSRFERIAMWGRTSIGLWGVTTMLAAPAATSQTLQRVIHGMVFDSRDQPIPLVNVSVPRGASAVSDDSGRFRLEISHRDRVVFDFRHDPSGRGPAVSLILEALLPNERLEAGPSR